MKNCFERNLALVLFITQVVSAKT